MDGYISRSFGPQLAERHFSHILKSKYVSASYCPGQDGGSFVVSSPNQHSWVLDRSAQGIGTVIPQVLWIPHTLMDRRLHVQDAELQRPIFFLHTDGRLGLTLEAAASGRCHTLLNSGCSAPLGYKTTIHIRIGVSEHFLSALVQLLMRFRRPPCSGVGIASSSEMYKSATKLNSAILLPCPSSCNTSGDRWIHSSRPLK